MDQTVSKQEATIYPIVAAIVACLALILGGLALWRRGFCSEPWVEMEQDIELQRVRHRERRPILIRPTSVTSLPIPASPDLAPRPESPQIAAYLASPPRTPRPVANPTSRISIPPAPTYLAPLPPLSGALDLFPMPPSISLHPPTPRNSYELEYRDLFTGPAPSLHWSAFNGPRIRVNQPRLLRTPLYRPIRGESLESMAEPLADTTKARDGLGVKSGGDDES